MTSTARKSTVKRDTTIALLGIFIAVALIINACNGGPSNKKAVYSEISHSVLDGNTIVAVTVNDDDEANLEKLTEELWIKYGDVGVLIYCGPSDQFFAQTHQTSATDYGGTQRGSC